MDFNSLRDQVSQLSLYDVKAGIRKVQNAVMNYTEMEAKVREATNNEPWGASSTSMQEIANGTFSYQLLNEIMPMIYKRFTEKSAEEWRQIYKALQLLEFLIKHGSERVIDDARSHLSLLKMLRQFHFIDQNGKDQGINVRNRSKELCELLGDVERIRAERKKARATKTKYSGVEGGAGSGMSGSSSRYGGFGSESGGAGGNFGGATRSVYGDGGGFGGEGQDEYDEGDRSTRNERFDEYDEYDDGGAQAPAHRRKPEVGASKKAQKKAEPPKPKEPEVDLFDFGDEPTTSTNGSFGSTMPVFTPAPSSSTMVANDDDDFDDFQSATPAPAPVAVASATSIPAIAKPNYSSFSTQFVQPSPQPGTQKAEFNNLLATRSPPPGAMTSSNVLSPTTSQVTPTGYQPTGPNYYTPVQAGHPQQSAFSTTSAGSIPGSSQAKKPAGGDAFASLLAGSAIKKSNTAAPKGMTIADMAKQKSQAGLYGANAPAAVSAPANNGTRGNMGSNNGLGDLLG